MHAPSSIRYRRDATPGKRDVRKVPFVELFNGRLQGVVSSGSDITRVYVSFFEAGTLHYYCSTNNNRPCGGLRGGPCKHLESLVREAVQQFGLAQVTTYLQLPAEATQAEGAAELAAQIRTRLAGSMHKAPAGEVFSRFLNNLRYMELPQSMQPVVEMAWFV